MASPKARTDHWLAIFSRLERRHEPLAPRWVFARRLARGAIMDMFDPTNLPDTPDIPASIIASGIAT
jgi:hypothetical protein